MMNRCCRSWEVMKRIWWTSFLFFGKHWFEAIWYRQSATRRHRSFVSMGSVTNHRRSLASFPIKGQSKCSTPFLVCGLSQSRCTSSFEDWVFLTVIHLGSTFLNITRINEIQSRKLGWILPVLSFIPLRSHQAWCRLLLDHRFPAWPWVSWSAQTNNSKYDKVAKADMWVKCSTSWNLQLPKD